MSGIVRIYQEVGENDIQLHTQLQDETSSRDENNGNGVVQGHTSRQDQTGVTSNGQPYSTQLIPRPSENRPAQVTDLASSQDQSWCETGATTTTIGQSSSTPALSPHCENPRGQGCVSVQHHVPLQAAGEQNGSVQRVMGDLDIIYNRQRHPYPETLHCRLCLDRRAEVLLIPCNHHILCGRCLPLFRRCPACDNVIHCTMNVYLV